MSLSYAYIRLFSSRAQVLDLRLAIATASLGSDRAHHAFSPYSEACVVLGHQSRPRLSGLSASISDSMLVTMNLISHMRLLRILLITHCESVCFCRDR